MSDSGKTERYISGETAAKYFLSHGGSPDADGPDTDDEEFFSGFIDTLAEAKRARVVLANCNTRIIFNSAQ